MSGSCRFHPAIHEGNALADDYIEFFVRWAPNISVAAARRRLEQYGFTVTTMQSGASLLGTKEQVERVFSVSLQHIGPPANLPVPAELRDYVEAVIIPRARSYHS
jgi:hypothetical protein